MSGKQHNIALPETNFLEFKGECGTTHLNDHLTQKYLPRSQHSVDQQTQVNLSINHISLKPHQKDRISTINIFVLATFCFMKRTVQRHQNAHIKHVIKKIVKPYTTTKIVSYKPLPQSNTFLQRGPQKLSNYYDDIYTMVYSD